MRLYSDQAPVVILGMHRSGTSLLTRALHRFGLFLGNDIDEATHESGFYIRINDLLLSQAASNWSSTHSLDALIASGDAMSQFESYYHVLQSGWRYSDYLGRLPYIYSLLGSMPLESWGWKDPRNCLTLPFWLRIYPNMRVINIQRHGTDVAMSLLTRNQQMTKRTLQRFQQRKWLYRLRYRRSPFPYSVFLNDFDGAIRLWDFYQQQAQEAILNANIDAHTIQYERFLEQPEEILTSLLNYLNIGFQQSELTEFCKQVDGSRRFAFVNDATSVAESVRHRSLLHRYGYSEKGYAE